MPVEETVLPEFNHPTHQAAFHILDKAVATGKLGSSFPEISAADKATLRALLRNTPWVLLTFQLVWSSIVVVISYFLAKNTAPADTTNTLRSEFWISYIDVSPSVTYSVGWALFVVFSLFIRAASIRYREGQLSVQNCGNGLRTVLRIIYQSYPYGTWHDGDMDRIAAHAIAYPIALKMSLRRERDPEQLRPLLHTDDVMDVITADSMHHHCLRVVRSYISVAENDSRDFNLAQTDATPAGNSVRRGITKLVDSIESTAYHALRIAEFRPAVTYINHMRIFFYIWMTFLPLALVKSSGWYVTFMPLVAQDYRSLQR